MKLTIEGIWANIRGCEPHKNCLAYSKGFDAFTADIQAYVKQEMRKIVVGVEFCNSDISAKGLQDKILTAIGNYGKDKGGL